MLVVSFLSYFSVLTAARAARHRRARRVQPADADVGVPRRRRLSLAAAAGTAGLFSVVDPRRVPARRRDRHDVEGRRRRSRRAVRRAVARAFASCTTRSISQAIATAAAEPLDPAHERAVDASGDRRRRPAGRREELSAADRRAGGAARSACRRGCSSSAKASGKRRCAQQIARLGLDDAVVLCGFQRNPWKYIARADVFALSSRYEGFGNVLVEAMACGVPVVATGSPGTREIVSVGTDGLLVDRHEPAALAAALAAVLSDAVAAAAVVAGRAGAARSGLRCRRSPRRTTACSGRCSNDRRVDRGSSSPSRRSIATVAPASSWASCTRCRR